MSKTELLILTLSQPVTLPFPVSANGNSILLAVQVKDVGIALESSVARRLLIRQPPSPRCEACFNGVAHVGRGAGAEPSGKTGEGSREGRFLFPQGRRNH